MHQLGRRPPNGLFARYVEPLAQAVAKISKRILMPLGQHCAAMGALGTPSFSSSFKSRRMVSLVTPSASASAATFTRPRSKSQVAMVFFLSTLNMYALSPLKHIEYTIIFLFMTLYFCLCPFFFASMSD